MKVSLRQLRLIIREALEASLDEKIDATTLAPRSHLVDPEKAPAYVTKGSPERNALARSIRNNKNAALSKTMPGYQNARERNVYQNMATQVGAPGVAQRQQARTKAYDDRVIAHQRDMKRKEMNKRVGGSGIPESEMYEDTIAEWDAEFAGE